MNFRRNNDLSEVFEQRYRANKGNNEIISEKKKEFNRKMFNIRDKEDIRKEIRSANSVEGQVKSLNDRMNVLNTNKGFNNIRNNKF